MVSIVICTVPGSEEMLKSCVNSVIRNTRQKYNLIVVKNIWDGFAKSYNRGIKAALSDEQEAIVIMNDDVVITSSNWLERFQQVAKEKEVGIIGNKTTNHDDNHVPFFFTYIKKEVFDKVGYLDERFEVGEWEDVDFCVRAVDAGFKTAETDSIDITHKMHGTLMKLSSELNEKRSKNKQIFLEKWKGTKWENNFK